MKLLRSLGLPPKQLQSGDCIYCPDSLTHYICYLSLGGHLTNQQRQRIINAFLKRARKFGFTETLYCIEDLFRVAVDMDIHGYIHGYIHVWISDFGNIHGYLCILMDIFM